MSTIRNVHHHDRDTEAVTSPGRVHLLRQLRDEAEPCHSLTLSTRTSLLWYLRCHDASNDRFVCGRASTTLAGEWNPLFGLRLLCDVQSAQPADRGICYSVGNVSGVTWHLAMDIFTSMKRKPAAVAARIPALTFIIIIAPVAFRMDPHVPAGLELLWHAARLSSRSKRAELLAAQRVRHIASQREPRAGPVEIRFPVSALIRTGAARHAAVPWLALLRDAAAGDSAVQQELDCVLQSAAAPTSRRVDVSALRVVFDAVTQVRRRHSAGPALRDVSRAASPSRTLRRLYMSTDSTHHSAEKNTTHRNDPASSSGGSTKGYQVDTIASMCRDLFRTSDAVVMPYRKFISPVRLVGLKMLLDAEDPPLHPEPFCAAPATLKAMAHKKEAQEAERPPTPAETARTAAQRAGRLVTAARLGALVASMDRLARKTNHDDTQQ